MSLPMRPLARRVSSLPILIIVSSRDWMDRAGVIAVRCDCRFGA
jgi:hypothetical protein